MRWEDACYRTGYAYRITYKKRVTIKRLSDHAEWVIDQEMKTGKLSTEYNRGIKMNDWKSLSLDSELFLMIKEQGYG